MKENPANPTILDPSVRPLEVGPPLGLVVFPESTGDRQVTINHLRIGSDYAFSGQLGGSQARYGKAEPGSGSTTARSDLYEAGQQLQCGLFISWRTTSRAAKSNCCQVKSRKEQMQRDTGFHSAPLGLCAKKPLLSEFPTESS